MKIAIHHSMGSFSDRWIEYCKENKIDYKLVNAYSNDIIHQVSDCDAFMWHHHHANYKDTLFAKQLLYSLQLAGKKVFPDFATGWHFDDKVGQKYLLEAIGAPLAPSYVFYSKVEAMHWADETTFPKVFKLRGGAGAANVKLVRSRLDAISLINKAFGKGFPQFDKWGNLSERFHRWRTGKDSFTGVLKGLGRLVVPTEFSKLHAPEKGYVYFQDFITGNKTDYRIKVVDGKCWGFQRAIRKDDFRASGSGTLIFNNKFIPMEMIKTALAISKKLSLQSVAFDFVIDQVDNRPLLIEASYGFGFDDEEMVHGYWTSDLVWHDEKFIPQYWMVENIIKMCNERLDRKV